MDIEEFLDRELADLGLGTEKTEKPEKSIELPQFKGDIEPSSLFDSIRNDLSKGNLDEAEKSYLQLWHLLMQQKLKWDKGVYNQLSVLSKQFSSALSQASNEMKRKTSSIYDLINRARRLLKEGKKEVAFKTYAEVQEMSNSIPNIFFEEKKVIRDQIMGFYKEISNTTDSSLISKVNGLLQEINQLLDRITNSIKSSDFANARSNYNRCIELYNQIPEGFIRSKNSAGMKLLEIYKTLSISTEISDLQRQLGQNVQLQGVVSSAPRVYPAKRYIPKRISRVRRIKETKRPIISKSPGKKEPLSRELLVKRKRDHAKRNIKKGFYNEAWKNIEEALEIDPKDVESKALKAKIKTLQ